MTGRSLSQVVVPRVVLSLIAASRDEQLAQVLVEFAHTLGTDFSVQRILDHLVLRIVDILPVTGAGVMIAQDGQELHVLAASDDLVTTIETLQNELGEGPGWTAFRTGEAVAVEDLGEDTRFPGFSPRADARGLSAVFTFPMRLDGDRLGVLDLYRDVPGRLSEWDERAGQVLADVAAAYLFNAQSRAEIAATVAKLTHRSLHDPLTGLPNRTLFEELLEQAVARARRSHHSTAVLFIDLDRFKTVNDQHGHHVGDDLLIAVASRLVAALRPGDNLARLGGDEFVVLCEDLSDGSAAETVAHRIVGVMNEPFSIAGRALSVTASVGIAYSGPGQDIPEELLRDADQAMYAAKNHGGARHAVVTPGARAAADRRQALEEDLAEAHSRGELVMHYQPIIDLQTGGPTAVEALVRWEHPVRGVVPPQTLVPSAERTGTILPLGEWVLRQACADAREWHREHPGLQVMVNVSAQQVTGPGFVRMLERVLSDTALAPSALFLEVTESVLLHDAARSFQVLRQVKTLGVRLSLDDFGTGYSSLSYLRHFPFDALKIDRSFTRNVQDDATTRSIVLAMVDLGHVLDLTVTAEGVETAAELSSVIDLGADHAQGFYLGPPKPKSLLALTAPPATPAAAP